MQSIVDAVKSNPDQYEEGYQSGLKGIMAGDVEPRTDAQISWYIGHSIGYWKYLQRLSTPQISKSEH